MQYYISSIKRNVKTFAKAVRGHWGTEKLGHRETGALRNWGIENSCHWVLDMTFREDESRIRDRSLTENMAWLRRFALGLLKRPPNGKKSLAMKRRIAGWSEDFLSQVVFGVTT